MKDGKNAKRLKREFRSLRKLKTGKRLSKITVRNWRQKWMRILDEWILDEGVQMGERKNISKSDKEFYAWLWSILDCKTRFFIASKIDEKRDNLERKNQ